MLLTTDEIVDWFLYGSRGWPVIVRLLVGFLFITFLTALVIVPTVLSMQLLPHLLPNVFVFESSSVGGILNFEGMPGVGFILGFLWLLFWVFFSAIWDTQLEKRRR